MAKIITSIALFNAPLYNSGTNRVVINEYDESTNFFQSRWENEKLTPYKIYEVNDTSDEFKKSFSFEIDNIMNLTITINEIFLGGYKTPNYMRIESNLFNNTRFAYYFLESTGVESKLGRSYTATIDTIATFGDKLLKILFTSNKQIYKIIRAHDYTLNAISDATNPFNKGYYYNENHMGLIHSDFNLLGTNQGLRFYENATNTIKPYDFGTNAITFNLNKAFYFDNPTTNIDNYINNRVVTKYDIDGLGNRSPNNGYYAYAVVQFQGTPRNLQAHFTNGNKNESLLNETVNDISVGVGKYKLLMPLGMSRDTYIYSPPLPNYTYWNGYDVVTTLPKGKILASFLSPIAIHNNNNPVYAIYDETKLNNGNSSRKIERSGTNVSSHFYISELDNYIEKLSMPKHGLYLRDKALNFNISSFDKIDSQAKFDTLIKLLYSPDLRRDSSLNITDTNTTYNLYSELGMYNTNITQLELIYLGDQNNSMPIDMWSFINNPLVEVSAEPDDTGLVLNIGISKRQYAQYVSNTNLNIFSSESDTYLANSRYQREATKSLVDQQKRQADFDAWKPTMSNPILSTILSFGQNFTQAGIQNQFNADNARLQKAQIDAVLADTKNMPSSPYGGSGNPSLFNENLELNAPFTYRYTYAPEPILRMIKEYYKRYGYLYNTYITNTSNNHRVDRPYQTKSDFNYYEIEVNNEIIYDTRDLQIHTDIIYDFNDLMKRGVRIWFNRDGAFVIDYSVNNIDYSVYKLGKDNNFIV